MLYVFPNWTESNVADLVHPGLQQFNYSNLLDLEEGNYTIVISVSAMGIPASYKLFSVDNSATVSFSVIHAPSNPTPVASMSLPESTPKSDVTLAPAESPTQQPTPGPSQTPDRLQVKDFAPVLIPAGMIILAIVAVGLLVYYTKRKRVKQ